MTKRFQLFQHKNEEYILDEPNTHLDFIEMLGDALTFEEIVDLLNEQHETITTLTSALKELKEIGDYQAMRITELDAENQKLNHRRQEDINELAIIAIKYKALEEENKALKDIKNICKKYNIKLEDVAETLEEYICLDNGEEL